MQVLPNATVGAEVRGVDLARAGAKEIADVKQAWYRHDVLVFRGQKLSDDHLLAFSKHFGTLDPPPNQGAGRKSPPGYPDIYVVSNVLDDYGEPIGALGDGEAAWHTDMSYIAWPPDASMLYSLEIPPSGGDTSFCSMRVALKKLPRALVERVRHRDIKHDGTYMSYIAWPPDASMLYSLEIPPSGGDTSFCSMRVALKKLPRALVERVRHRDIKHDG